MRLALHIMLIAFFWSSAVVPARADNSGTLRITVAAENSNAPLAFSQVDLYGPRSLRGAAGSDGVVVFDELPAGTYEVVVHKSRYIERTLRSISVLPGKEVVLSVLLPRAPREIPAWLRRIGNVGSKPVPKSSTTQTTSESTEAKLSNSMVNALGALPGIDLRNTGPTRNVSIGGHPVSETLVSIDGVPVSPLGSSADFRALSLDLFSSVAVNRTTPNGTAAGTIDFNTRNPTLDWIGTGTAIHGAYGNAAATSPKAGRWDAWDCRSRSRLVPKGIRSIAGAFSTRAG